MSTPVPQPIPPAISASAPVFSVSSLNRLVRETLERALPLSWISGEISNLTRAASGHVYFSLRDASAQARCVMFRNRAQLVPFELANGLQVEVRALVTLYEARGDFQLNVETARRAGLGALFEAFARLKDKLAAEGLFDDARKRPLPRFPRRIGVITSLQAAALRDVLAALARRAPQIPILVHAVPVQGEGAAAEIANALRLAAARNECEVLIVARGGGSIEDLWAFNEENLARAIAACPMPVIAGIGHESDFTIADLVADQRAATPTAAAELASAGWFAARIQFPELGRKLRNAIEAILARHMQQVDVAARRLVHPAQRLREAASRLAHLGARITSAASRGIERNAAQLVRLRLTWNAHRPDFAAMRTRCEGAESRLTMSWARTHADLGSRIARLADALAHLNPQATLDRGYSITYAADGSIVRNSKTVAPGNQVSIRFAAGTAHASITRSD
ncbi:MAG: exodeoxyribonuclease VII large subunit [Sterolibacteriaceae bacterium]|uniref:Exodeoxyribonuclease 7 large subunit n=1 Tax=Candidatus Methylophosphatis roskildensis TaxID=2899263 RepID=A0A9D7DZC8_9PROT|nr:exodeoxyribonuclease VII large subunit [Candidatus Methylophosphatis roskildensis]